MAAVFPKNRMNRIQPFRQAVILTLALLTVLPSALRAEDPAPKSDTTPATPTAPTAPTTPATGTAARRERQAAADRLEAARERRDARMAELGLTDEQRDKLRAAQRAQAEKLRAVREDSSLSREQKTAKARELRDSLMATTKSILTAEQFEKWEKSRESRRARPGTPSVGTTATDPAPAGGQGQ